MGSAGLFLFQNFFARKFQGIKAKKEEEERMIDLQTATADARVQLTLKIGTGMLIKVGVTVYSI